MFGMDEMKLNGNLQGIQSADSIYAINLFTSGGNIRSIYSQCHVDPLACTELNVNNQTLTQV